MKQFPDVLFDEYCKITFGEADEREGRVAYLVFNNEYSGPNREDIETLLEVLDSEDYELWKGEDKLKIVFYTHEKEE